MASSSFLFPPFPTSSFSLATDPMVRGGGKFNQGLWPLRKETAISAGRERVERERELARDLPYFLEKM